MLISTAKIPAVAALFAAAAVLTTLAATSTAALAKKGIQPKPIAHECFWFSGAKSYLGGDDKFTNVNVHSTPQPKNLIELGLRTLTQAQINIDVTVKGFLGVQAEPIDLDTETVASEVKTGYCVSARRDKILVGFDGKLSAEHEAFLRDQIKSDVNAGLLPGGLPLVDHQKRNVVIDPQIGMSDIDKLAFIGESNLTAAVFAYNQILLPTKPITFAYKQIWLPRKPNKPDALRLGNFDLSACPANPGRPSPYFGDPRNQKFYAGAWTCRARSLAQLAKYAR